METITICQPNDIEVMCTQIFMSEMKLSLFEKILVLIYEKKNRENLEIYPLNKLQSTVCVYS